MNALDDIALIRFDSPLLQKDMNQNSTEMAVFPICLPDSSYNEINKISMYYKPQENIDSLSDHMDYLIRLTDN